MEVLAVDDMSGQLTHSSSVVSTIESISLWERSRQHHIEALSAVSEKASVAAVSSTAKVREPTIDGADVDSEGSDPGCFDPSVPQNMRSANKTEDMSCWYRELKQTSTLLASTCKHTNRPGLAHAQTSTVHAWVG